AGKLDEEVEGNAARDLEEIVEAGGAQHVADLVRIADGSGRAPGQDAAAELDRRDHGAFHMDMGVDEAGDDHLAAGINLPLTAIVGPEADDRVAADGHIALGEKAPCHVQIAPALEHQIGGGQTPRLVDAAFQKLLTSSHPWILSAPTLT